MKKLKHLLVGIFVFCVFGVMDIHADTLSVKDIDGYKKAIEDSSVSIIKLEQDLDISKLDGANYKDVIHVNRNIVLDLNGHVITTGDYGTITVYYDSGDYTFTIKSSSDGGKIHSTCKFNLCTASIVLLNTEKCTNCDSKLVLQDITIKTTDRPFNYLINIGSPETVSKYNVEIVNVKLENYEQAKGLFAHNFAYNSTSPILKLNIKSMGGAENEGYNKKTNIKYINADSEYKIKDILDPTTSELLVNGIVITDPEMKISAYDVSAGFEIRQKSLIDVTFADKQYGYSNISAKPITIKNNDTTSKQVKSVTVSDTSKFTIIGNTQPTIAVGSTNNTSFTIKPVNGLGVGEHTATITVTDMNDKEYQSKVTFTVNKADITPSVSIDGWFYEDTANVPSIIGNLGNGTVRYEYKVQGASDTTYSTIVPTKAGKYILRATVAPSTNHNGAVVTAKFAIEYKVIDGEDQKHTIGKIKDATFRIDAEKSRFLTAYLNGDELDSKFYTITEGSTIITLKQEFLNNLLPGTYNLKATFNDGGEANTTFEITSSVENSPKTGDSIIVSIVLGSISLIGLLGIGLYLRKKTL